MSDHGPVPAVVICRDRMAYTRNCVNSLASCPGVGDIHLVDHGSTWEPMLGYLARVAGQRGGRRIHVHWMRNAHPRDLWTNGTLESIVNPQARFLVTDCDVVAPFTPGWLANMHAILDVNPHIAKVGLALSTQYLPPGERGRKVAEWESQFRPPRARAHPERPGWIWASVDTTLALYPRLEPYRIDPSVRTLAFQGMHLPWYEHETTLTDEQRYYYEHAEHAGHWNPLREGEFVDGHGI